MSTAAQFRTAGRTGRLPTVALPPVRWDWFAVAMGPLLLVYLLLLNPYWVPSGDGEVYTAMARSIVRGEGLAFNGARAAIAPPGWPMVLAAAMTISPEFWFLKLVNIVSMLGGLGISFFILRRFAPDPLAAGIVLMAGTLQQVYPLTFWLHTEAFFFLLASAAMLLAVRLSENRGGVPTLLAMLVLISAVAFTRWPGMLHAILLVALLLRGDLRHVTAVRWTAALLAVAVATGTFTLTHRALSMSTQEKRAALLAGGTEDRSEDAALPTFPATWPTDLMAVPATVPATQAAPPSVVPLPAEAIAPTALGAAPTSGSLAGLASQYLQRIGSAGKWFSWLYWHPTRFGQSVPAINAAGLIAGWVCIGLLVLAMIRGIEQRNWFWVGLALYTGGLVLAWPNPNSRYYMPIAPFALLGVLLGVQMLGRWVGLRLLARAVGVFFVASVVVVNLALLTIEISVFRSADFYARYEAGMHQGLLGISQRLRAVEAGQIAVSDRYVNFARARENKFGLRAMHLLTDRVVRYGRTDDVRSRRGIGRLSAWARDAGITWYVFLEPAEPWRLWHFRLPPDLQQRLSGKPVERRTGGWQLFQLRGNRLVRTTFDDGDTHRPTRVPGL